MNRKNYRIILSSRSCCIGNLRWHTSSLAWVCILPRVLGERDAFKLLQLFLGSLAAIQVMSLEAALVARLKIGALSDAMPIFLSSSFFYIAVETNSRAKIFVVVIKSSTGSAHNAIFRYRHGSRSKGWYQLNRSKAVEEIRK